MWWKKKVLSIHSPPAKTYHVPKPVMSELEKARQDRDGKWITIEVLVTPGMNWTSWRGFERHGVTEGQIARCLHTMACYFTEK